MTKLTEVTVKDSVIAKRQGDLVCPTIYLSSTSYIYVFLSSWTWPKDEEAWQEVFVVIMGTFRGMLSRRLLAVYNQL